MEKINDILFYGTARAVAWVLAMLYLFLRDDGAYAIGIAAAWALGLIDDRQAFLTFCACVVAGSLVRVITKAVDRAKAKGGPR